MGFDTQHNNKKRKQEPKYFVYIFTLGLSLFGKTAFYTYIYTSYIGIPAAYNI